MASLAPPTNPPPALFPPPSVYLPLQVFSLLRLSEPTRLQRIMTNGVRTFSLLMVPIAASVPSVRTTIGRGLGSSFTGGFGSANGDSCANCAKPSNPSLLSLPVHGPVLVLLQPGWVRSPAVPSFPACSPTATPARPAGPEPLQRPFGCPGAPIQQATWEVNWTQFWMGTEILF